MLALSRNKGIVTEGDPLAYVMAPPPNESDEQKQARLAAEAEAKRISDAIDEEIQRQAKAEKSARRPVKILLLGACPTAPADTPRAQRVCRIQARANPVRALTASSECFNAELARPKANQRR